jgi:hypothetical protein
MSAPNPNLAAADRIAGLHPEPGQALAAAEILDGLADAAEVDLRKVPAILARDHAIRANPVNDLYFWAANGHGLDADDARRYLPNRWRPAAGIRIQQAIDDPFAVLAASTAVTRAAVAFPRAAAKLGEQVTAGRISDATRTEITAAAAARHRAEVGTSPDIAAAVNLMLPAGAHSE